MATARFQVTIPFAPDLPRNVVSNSFYLKDTLPGGALFADTDWGALASDAADVWHSAWLGVAPLKKITVKVYDVAGPPPHDPQVTHVLNPDAALASSSFPTQVALCLSYKGGQRPWQRGRMYLPTWLTGQFFSSMGQRPSQAMRDAAIALADGIANLGGINIDWVVHSKTRGEDYAVSQAWVDDAWDVQRRRRLDETARTTKAYSE